VRNIFTDFKRHDLGPNFHERNFDGTTRTQFLTTALWGVANTGPYGHDGRSMNFMDVILRHGGEALASRNAFANAGIGTQRNIIHFLDTLVLFPPDDTASNLQPAAPSTAGYPQVGHGSIRLGALFNNPNDPE
jgi:di-heme oxidoreductase (putative peroxidase)